MTSCSRTSLLCMVVILFGRVLTAQASPACDAPIPSEFGALAQVKNPAEIQERSKALCEKWGSAAATTQVGSGGLQSVTCMGDSGPDGPTLSWHANGKLASQGQITSRSGEPKLCGEWKRFFATGELRDAGEWVDGVPSGEWKRRESPGAVLTEMSFARAFKRGGEWSVLLGTNAMVDSVQAPPGSPTLDTRIPLPGVTAGGRWGYRLFSWLFLEIGAGADVFIVMGSNLSGSWTHASVNPFLTGHAYWTGVEGRLRIGVQGGVLAPLDFPPGSSFNLFPLIFLAGQYEFAPFGGKQRWFLEAASGLPPFFGNPYMARVLMGLRW